MAKPFVSVVLPTKNALPHLKNAIECLKKQTHKNFEVIIQDHLSTDGTLEYLEEQKKFLKLDIISEPDSGIGQAYGRGIVRSNGDFICLSAADERLFNHSLDMALNWHKQFPNAAISYGGSLIIDENEKEIARFIPAPFNFKRLISCDFVPPIAGLLNRKVIGDDLYYDQSLKTCPDYDFWLRLGSRFPSELILNRSELFMMALGNRTSMSFRVEAFEQFCKDKIFIMNRFLDFQEKSQERETLRMKSEEGIYSWASRMAISIDLNSHLTHRLCEVAERIYQSRYAPKEKTNPIRNGITLDQTHKIMISGASKIYTLKESLRYIYSRILKNTKEFSLLFAKNPALGLKKIISPLVSYRYPTLIHKLKKYSKLLLKSDVNPFVKKNSIKFKGDNPIRVTGGSNGWGYMMQWKLNDSLIPQSQIRHWVKFRLKTTNGSIGVCLVENGVIEKEFLYPESNKERDIYFPLREFSNISFIIRNGGCPCSSVEIYEATLLQSIH